MPMVWVDLKPWEGGVRPILDFLTEILPDTRRFGGCQNLKVRIEGSGEGVVLDADLMAGFLDAAADQVLRYT